MDNASPDFFTNGELTVMKPKASKHDEKSNPTPEPVNCPKLEPAGPRKKEWAVLVYLGGENNLSDEMVFAIKAMKSSVSPPALPPGRRRGPKPRFNFHALVEFAAEEPARPSSALPPPRRFILSPWDEDGTLKCDFQEPESHNLPASYQEELIRFLLWGIKEGDAKHYLVIFSGHGVGIESNFLTKDSTPPQSLTVKQFREVLGNRRVKTALKGKRIDILGLDSCLMSMAEIGYELRNDVSIMVSSQGSQANLGWPYKAIFSFLQKFPKPSPEELAKNIVDKFVLYYDDFAYVANNSADLSACRLHIGRYDYMQSLKNSVEELAGAISVHFPKDCSDHDPAQCDFAKSLIFAHWYAQTYFFDQYADLRDLCGVLSLNLPSLIQYDQSKGTCYQDIDHTYDLVRLRCEQVIKAVEAAVIEPDAEDPRRFAGPLYQYSFGISIYFPWGEIHRPYGKPKTSEQLAFLKNGKWLRFIDGYIKFTQRPMRDAPAGWVKFETKDSPPHTKGSDDPRVRAKNPPSAWKTPTTFGK